MHIAAVSDIHARPNGLDKDLLEAIRNRAANSTPDVFIVAGDLSERLDDLDLALSSIIYPCTPVAINIRKINNPKIMSLEIG